MGGGWEGEIVEERLEEASKLESACFGRWGGERGGGGGGAKRNEKGVQSGSGRRGNGRWLEGGEQDKGRAGRVADGPPPYFTLFSPVESPL
jgi:hypothetical protein